LALSSAGMTGGRPDRAACGACAQGRTAGAQGLVAGAADRGRSAVECVLCLGHNKGMEEAASDLAVRSGSGRCWAGWPGALCMLGYACWAVFRVRMI